VVGLPSKAQYNRLKAQGMCTDCGTNAAREKKTNCQSCANAAILRAKERGYWPKQDKKRYWADKDTGRCITHGCKNLAAANKSKCLECASLFNEYIKERYRTIPGIAKSQKKRKREIMDSLSLDEKYFKTILWKFNWTQGEYMSLWETQGRKCGNPNCFETSGLPSGGRMHLDHDKILYAAGFKHESVRALLCHACNTFLGKMGENEGRIMGLSIWLGQHRERRNKILGGE
jgi:ribosomal protein L37E